MIVISQTEHGFKGRDNQDNLATWQEIFLDKSIPQLEFCNKIKFG